MTLVCSSRCLFSFPSFCEQDLASLNSLDDNSSYHARDCLCSASFFAQFVLLLLFSSKQSLKSFSPKLLGKVKMPTRYTTFTLTRFHLNQQIVPFSSPLDVYKAQNTLNIQLDFLHENSQNRPQCIKLVDRNFAFTATYSGMEYRIIPP